MSNDSSGNVENVVPNENSLDCRPCDPLKILKFVECLSATTNSIEMQILVNKYVSIVEKKIDFRFDFIKRMFYVNTDRCL